MLFQEEEYHSVEEEISKKHAKGKKIFSQVKQMQQEVEEIKQTFEEVFCLESVALM